MRATVVFVAMAALLGTSAALSPMPPEEDLAVGAQCKVHTRGVKAGYINFWCVILSCACGVIPSCAGAVRAQVPLCTCIPTTDTQRGLIWRWLTACMRQSRLHISTLLCANTVYV